MEVGGRAGKKYCTKRGYSNLLNPECEPNIAQLLLNGCSLRGGLPSFSLAPILQALVADGWEIQSRL